MRRGRTEVDIPYDLSWLMQSHFPDRATEHGFLTVLSQRRFCFLPAREIGIVVRVFELVADGKIVFNLCGHLFWNRDESVFTEFGLFDKKGGIVLSVMAAVRV